MSGLALSVLHYLTMIRSAEMLQLDTIYSCFCKKLLALVFTSLQALQVLMQILTQLATLFSLSLLGKIGGKLSYYD